MPNLPYGSDNKIGQLLVESEFGQATPQDDRTRRITSGNIVVGQGKSPSSTPPTEENRQLDEESDGFDTASDLSLSSSSRPHSRTSISIKLSEAITNLKDIIN